MPIVTGAVNVKTTATRTSAIEYTCTNCKNKVISPVSFKKTANGKYFALQKQEAKQKVRNDTLNAAAKKLDKQDAALSRQINEKHRYDMLPAEITCPNCNTKQVWSMIPQPWYKKNWFIPWIIVFLIFLVMALSFLWGNKLSKVIIGVVIAVLALAFHIAWVIVRKIRQKAAKETDFLPPIYIKQTDLEQKQ